MGGHSLPPLPLPTHTHSPATAPPPGLGEAAPVSEGGGMAALYACTKCHQRFPFEALSQGQQLCKVGGGMEGRWDRWGRG